MKKVILIDLDDTLNNLLECWLSLYNEKYEDDLELTNIISWDITQFVKPEAVDNIYELLKTPDLFSECVQPKPGSIKATQILSKYYDLYILTACTYPENIIEKFKWIQNNFPHIPVDNIITAKNKGLIVGDYIIDDNYDNLISSKCDKKLLFFMPHNIFNEIGDDIVRVFDWSQILWFFATENEELKNDVIENFVEEEFNDIQLPKDDEKIDGGFIEQYYKFKNIFS